MKFIQRPVPAGVKESLLKTLPAYEGSVDAGGGKAQPILLPIFVLGLRDLARGTVADGAKQVGWQYLTKGPNDFILSCELPDRGSGGEATTITRSKGPSFELAFTAYDGLQKVNEFQNNDYEPRTLRIPNLNIEAFWLRKKPDNHSAEQLDADLVVPFQSYSPDLLSQPYLMKDFLAILRPLARKQLNTATPRD